ncbi:MAG: phosphatidate cytidylyltransferase [Desulfobacteraceae bacterium]
MHLKRWLTGIAALPVLIYLIGFGPRWAFYAFLLLASLIAYREFLKITVGDIPARLEACSAIPVILLFAAVWRGPFYLVPAAVSLAAAIPLALALLFPHQREKAVDYASKFALGFVYVCIPLSMLVFMDRYPGGNVWIFYLLAVVFSSDTGAFYFGRFLGRTKLHPSVSPGKTWEGAAGGLLFSLVPGYAFYQFFQAGKPGILLLSLGLCVAGQVGDLVESLIKRTYGVKDSGTLLPGHGGLLDRIDGLLFASPALYVYLTHTSTF